MGGGSSTAAENYAPDPETDKKAIEITTPASCHYYGKGKPLDKSGKDGGLKEIYSSWKFPSSDGSKIVILPKWNEGVHGDWSQTQFDDSFDSRLGSHGMTEAAWKELVSKLNRLLKAYYPFQRDRKKSVKSITSDRGWNAKTKGIDTNGTHNYWYALQMRKLLAKTGQEYPRTNWSLQIHKHTVGGDVGLFTEKIYHTITIAFGDKPPAWWDVKENGTGSYWHTWKDSSEAKGETKGKDSGNISAMASNATTVAPSPENVPAFTNGNQQSPSSS